MFGSVSDYILSLNFGDSVFVFPVGSGYSGVGGLSSIPAGPVDMVLTFGVPNPCVLFVKEAFRVLFPDVESVEALVGLGSLSVGSGGSGKSYVGPLSSDDPGK